MAQERSFLDRAVNFAQTGLNGGEQPFTRTRLSYGFSLHASLSGRGPQIIGTLDSVRFGQSRDVDEEYEVEANATGLPRDMVPQKLGRREISFHRLDTYSVILEELFGSPELITLLDQPHPLTLREIWKDPSGVFSTTSRAYQYTGVYMTDLQREVRAKDDRIVGTDVTFKWKNRTRII